MTAPPQSARRLAHQVLERAVDRTIPPSRRLEELLGRSTLSPGDRGWATQMVHGVLRRQPTLDLVLKKYLQRPLGQVEGGALNWLRLATYELLFVPSTPSYAVLNETVNAAKQAGQPRWAGFLNGVLRSLTRDLTEEYQGWPAANTVPDDEGRYRLLKQSPFPDPVANPADYLAAAFSLPAWLVGRWTRRFSSEDLRSFGFWFNAPPRLSLRTNTLRTTRDALLEALRERGVAAQPGQQPEAIVLERTTRVTELPGFADGWFAVQDESAMAAARLLAPRPGERVLDLCAAPGGKTTHLAQLMENQGEIVAVDVDIPRLSRVTEACRRLGLGIVRCELLGREAEELPVVGLDAILLDVPCSNTGVLGKRPEVRWRLQTRDLHELAKIQSRLLRMALRGVRPGGRVVYSTCSLEPEENEELVRRVVQEQGGFQIVRSQLHLPGRPGDGACQCLLESSGK
ncbi:MAG: 16S rRNA (cytosine(967)-C(5))-methyltransferase RsmB [Planctomycetaceae bacterium]